MLPATVPAIFLEASFILFQILGLSCVIAKRCIKHTSETSLSAHLCYASVYSSICSSRLRAKCSALLIYDYKSLSKLLYIPSTDTNRHDLLLQ